MQHVYDIKIAFQMCSSFEYSHNTCTHVGRRRHGVGLYFDIETDTYMTYLVCSYHNIIPRKFHQEKLFANFTTCSHYSTVKYKGS